MRHDNRPKVGIGIIVLKESRVLLRCRKGAHGTGEYAGPGGHLEYMESFTECAVRETREEAGIEIMHVRFLCLSNLKMYGHHYVDIGLVADWGSGEPQVLEPDKCEAWGWYDLDNLPSPLFGAEPLYLEALKAGRNYFDS
jgi:8-oxo-dGTP diphosphatase